MKEEVIQGDCLVEMQKIPDKSIDMILCDLPYGTTACKWDTIIPFEPLWEQYKRIIKDNGAIVLTASQPFTSALVMSNIKMFKYNWYWIKNATGFLNAKKMPMKSVEDVCVFYNNLPTYNPQNLIKVDEPKINHNSKARRTESGKGLSTHNGGRLTKDYIQEFSNYPKQHLIFSNEKGLHPTQKPVALFEYLIKTYTNEGDIVLDNCAGSGTTGVACQNLKRDFILIEKEPEYVEIIKKRLTLPQ